MLTENQGKVKRFGEEVLSVNDYYTRSKHGAII